MSNQIKIGVVGCGYLGSRHIKHLSSMDEVEQVVVWDLDQSAMAAMRDEFGVMPANSLEDLLQSVDAVDIVSPTQTHFDVAKAALEADKPVFVEKPICASVEDAEELVELADSLGLPLQVGHIERFNAAFRALKSIEVSPRFIEVHRLSPWTPRGVDVAVVHDLMIHDLDLILTLAGSGIDHVHANGVGVITDSVDIANTRIQFKNGLVVNATASRMSLKRMRKMRIFARNAYIALDLGKGTCEYVRLEDGDAPTEADVQTLGEIDFLDKRHVINRSFLTAPEGDAMRLELTEFCDTVINGSPIKVSGENGLNALKLAEQVVATIQGKA